MTASVGTRWAGGWMLVAVFSLSGPSQAQTASQAEPRGSCVACHRMLTDTRLSAPVGQFTETDVHRDSGFFCTDCHGGDASASLRENAHDVKAAFRGRPTGQAVIGTCTRCHSDAETMRRFAPRQRVDQAAEYATSVHGKQLAAGDSRVATCTSCHGAHGVRTVKDAKSPVYPTNVANTCATCHASAGHMKGYALPDGSPLPTNQLEEYQQSEHYAAMVRRDDLSAPTCNDCHGNHGAVPPGAGTVANVCGTCHAAFAQKFNASAHRDLFDKGCVECHGNHAVGKPTDAMLGTADGSLCGSCHSGGEDKGAQAANKMRTDIESLKSRLDASSALIDRVRNAGMEVSGQELAIGEARTRLTLARTEMHASSVSLVESVISEGLRLTDDVDAAGARSLAELRFRRRGLAVSLVAILLVVVGLAIKVRQIDRRHMLR